MGWCREIFKNNQSETGMHYFEEISRTRIKLILQIIVVHSTLQTDWSGWQVATKRDEKHPKITFFRACTTGIFPVLKQNLFHSDESKRFQMLLLFS